MTLPTKELQLLTSEVADSAGSATFTFPAVPSGYCGNGTVAVTDAPATALVAVSVNGTARGTQLGSAPFGPVFAYPGGQVTLTVTGLTAGVEYTALWYGTLTDATQTYPQSPSPLANAVAISSGSVTINGTPTVTIAGTPNVTVANTPAVTISGTPTVSIAANQVVNVQNVPSGSLTVAGTVNIGNTPSVTISGTPSVTIASGTVSISGSITVGSITAGTVNVQNVPNTALLTVDGVDLLDAQSALSVSTSQQSHTCSTTALNQYAGILIATGSPIGGSTFDQIAIRVLNTTQSITSGWQTAANLNQTAGLFFFPIPVDKGDTIQYQYNTVGPSGGGGSGTLAVRTYGLGTIPPNAPPLRPDGRLISTGRFAAGAELTASGAVVAAPAFGKLMLYSLSIGGGIIASGGALAVVRGTINGTVTDLASASCSANGGGQGSDKVWPQGLLLDNQTGLSFVALVGAASQPFLIQASYDVVE